MTNEAYFPGVNMCELPNCLHACMSAGKHVRASFCKWSAYLTVTLYMCLPLIELNSYCLPYNVFAFFCSRFKSVSSCARRMSCVSISSLALCLFPSQPTSFTAKYWLSRPPTVRFSPFTLHLISLQIKAIPPRDNTPSAVGKGRTIPDSPVTKQKTCCCAGHTFHKMAM